MNSPAAKPASPQGEQRLTHSLFWALAGNGTFVLGQFALFLAITWLTTTEDLGRYGFATAVAAPIFMLTNLGLRVGQSTDGAEHYTFSEYLGLRTLTSLLGMALALAIGLIVVPDPQTAAIICVIALVRFVESYSDLFYGVFQRRNRLDLVARSLILRSAISITIFTVALWISGDVALSLIAQLVVWGLVAGLHDYRLAAPAALSAPEARPNFSLAKLLPLAKTSLPLGGGAFLAQLVSISPRFVVEHFFGLTALGYFTAIAYVYQTGQFFVAAIGHSLIARIADLYQAGKSGALYQLIGLSTIGVMLLGGLGIIIGQFAGEWILQITFGAEFAPYASLLVAILIALTFALGAAIMQTAIAGLRRFKSFAAIHIVLLPINLALTITGAEQMGLDGVGYGMAGTAALHLLITLGVFFVLERRQK